MQTAYGKQSYHTCMLGMLDSPRLSSGLVNGKVGAGTVSFGDLLEYEGATQTKKYSTLSGGGKIVGVCMREDTKQTGPYAVGEEMTVMRKGRIWVSTFAGIAIAAAHPACDHSMVLDSGVDPFGVTLYLVEFDITAPNTYTP